MGILNRPKKKQYRPRTHHSPEARQEFLEKQTAWKAFVRHMEKNPQLEQEFMFKKLGIEKPGPEDPSAELERQTKKEIVSEAFKLIKEDPELRREYAEAILPDIIGKKNFRRSNGEGGPMILEGGSSIQNLLADLQGLAEAKEMISSLTGDSGGAGGFFSGLKMTDIIGALVALKGGALPETTEPRYVVQLNGEAVSVTESKYNQLLQEGQIRPIAAIGSGPQIRRVIEEKTTAEVLPKQEPSDLTEEITLPEVDAILKFVDFEDLFESMEMEPDDFAMNLGTDASSGDQGAIYLWSYLCDTTYDEMINFLTPYKSDHRVAPLVEKLTTPEVKAWAEQVILNVVRIQKEGEEVQDAAESESAGD